MSGIPIQIGPLSVCVRKGQALLDICDHHSTQLRFNCRAGSCGTCLIRVLDGMANLSALTENEAILLPELTDDPNARLACQVQIHGPVTVESLAPTLAEEE